MNGKWMAGVQSPVASVPKVAAERIFLEGTGVVRQETAAAESYPVILQVVCFPPRPASPPAPTPSPAALLRHLSGGQSTPPTINGTRHQLTIDPQMIHVIQ
jgi:hypothetical protein